MTHPTSIKSTARAIWKRIGAEQGFTMIVALGVMTVTALLVGAVLLAVQGDAYLTRADLDGQRAYSAAQAGVQAYLYQLNNSTGYWDNCANDTRGQTTVPGSTTGVSYSWVAVPANSYTACSTGSTIPSLIDTATGTLRMEFTGYSRAVTRTIVASFETVTPLKFLWYTVHETADASTPGCGLSTFYYNSSIPPQCQIVWVTGDYLNGPMYTQDQFLVQPGGSPTFGRGPSDTIASQAPAAGTNPVCVAGNCQNATILGTTEPDVHPQVPLPTDNSALLTDANTYGQVYAGTTTITMNPNGTTANVWNCPSSSSSAPCTNTPSLNLVTHPVIYATGSCGSSYSPTNVTYSTNTTGHYFGTCGDIYVSGTYTTPLTIAAGDDVIVTGDLETTEVNGTPTGAATLGLVASAYVRVMHSCTGGNPDLTIDGAILTLTHSFFVDNYQCGGSSLGKLTVNGAIAQQYRGIVGTVNASGYLKNYNYDNRLAYALPPYLFNLTTFSWSAFRETLCTPNSNTASSASCSYTGP
jgi:type II secretory pathway pseudopilin PulG